MKVIQPNCRVQFTAEDVDFILSVLAEKTGQAEYVTRLLADEATRDIVLDDEALFRAVLERRGCLSISSHFYFYVLVRRVLLQTGITDRAVADYVAELLAEFSRTERTRCVAHPAAHPLDYFFEMLAALQTADDRSSFLIRAHIGNHSLFLSGVFPEHIRCRSERRGFPDLSYYEELGRSNFRAARDHRLARRYHLTDVFDTLSEQFNSARRALNDLGERLVSLSDLDCSKVLVKLDKPS
jgi:hypothetical protein